MVTNKKELLFAVAFIAVFVLLSCAPGNPRWDPNLASAHKAGFWAGIWHGFIIVITFIVSLFNKSVHIYEAHNTGWSYNLGYLIGLFFSIGGGFRASTHRWNKRRYVVETKRNE